MPMSGLRDERMEGLRDEQRAKLDENDKVEKKSMVLVLKQLSDVTRLAAGLHGATVHSMMSCLVSTPFRYCVLGTEHAMP